MTLSIAGKASYLADPQLQKLLAALSQGGEEARIAGGAVRDAILSRAVGDVDIATTTTPQETVARAQAAGFKTVPTGIDHGTITVLAGKPYEVTTLRTDVETDGRHAVVAFGKDWQADAERRDFTINALYAKADGTVVDLVGGLADLDRKLLRFIGDPDARIREDYLRILRFFRFFAWYGEGRPDAEGLKACARLKDGLATLSAERVWSELRRLLAAPDPARALLWMRQASVLTTVLPESEKWGIDAIHGLIAAESAFGWLPDPILRLEAIVPPDPARMEALGRRLKTSNADRERLVAWAMSPAPTADLDERALRSRLYIEGQVALGDHLRLGAARALAREDRETAENLQSLYRTSAEWTKPLLPVSGRDLIAAGYEKGPAIGETLARLEKQWVESDFSLTRDALLDTLRSDPEKR